MLSLDVLGYHVLILGALRYNVLMLGVLIYVLRPEVLRYDALGLGF